MLNAAKSEVQRHDTNATTSRLNKLIDNEILLIQASQRLQEWSKNFAPPETEVLVSKCRQVIKASASREGIVPRTEITSTCAAVLLNLNETTELIRADRRFPLSELYVAVASVIYELEHKTNTSKKVFRDAWDLISLMFANNSFGHSSSNRRNHQQPMEVEDNGETVDSGNSRNNDNDDVNTHDGNMPYDESSGKLTGCSIGDNGSNLRATDDDVERNNSPKPGSSNERTDSNPFRNLNRNNYGNDNYGIRESPAVVVNSNLLPFIQNLRDPLRGYN